MNLDGLLTQKMEIYRILTILFWVPLNICKEALDNVVPLKQNLALLWIKILQKLLGSGHT